MSYKIINGDCKSKLKELDDNSVDSVVTDPPYFLTDGNTIDTVELLKSDKHPSSKKGFMGRDWDGGTVEVVELDRVPEELL